MKRVALGIFVLVATVAVCLATSAPAMADHLSISINGGAACLDNAACDVNPAVGTVSVNGTFGSFSVNAATGVALSGISMDLGYVVTSTAAGTVVIDVSQDNLGPANGVSFTAALGGTQASGMTTTFNTWADPTNTLFGKGASNVLCHPATAISTSPVVSATCTSGSFSSGASKFSLTEEITVVSTGSGQNASGDLNLSASPEPGSMMLFGSGLIGLAGLIRRKLNA